MSFQDLIILFKYSAFVESSKSLFSEMPTMLDAFVYVAFMSSLGWFLAIAIDNDKYPKLNDFIDRIL